VEIKVNRHNDLVIKFNRPVFAPFEKINDNDFRIQFRNLKGENQLISCKGMLFNLPSRYLYLKIKPDFNITGSILRDQYATLTYMNTQSLVDINGK
jgi:hypothetical protein